MQWLLAVEWRAKGEDSWGKNGIDEILQERRRRGGSAPAHTEKEVLQGNQQGCNERSILAHLFVFSLNGFCYVSIFFYESK
ncbi:hypothetical protein COL23_05700 [Priestia aryabhattai]|uniref:hypothetical protein n=1 Tax=Priestia megaterium TaxID=1404 RepID=UPI000BF4F648|nr:hypothetical protein [Bacillus sp. S35]PFW78760.1 hypothetical protein COL23_05700 [Priestia aryabhattai]